MAKAKKKKKGMGGGDHSLAALLKARINKLWARFEKTGALGDYLAYDDALNAAKTQGLKIDRPGG